MLGTAGAWRWLKTESGSGSDKWTVVYGDTGWRNVASLLGEPFTIGPTPRFIRMKRTADLIICQMLVATTEAFALNSAKVLLALPEGFKTKTYTDVGVLSQPADRVFASVYAAGSGNLEVLIKEAWGDARVVRGTLVFPPSQSWPTTLPGTPA